MRKNLRRQPTAIVFSMIATLLGLSALVLLSMNWLQRERNPEEPGDRARLVGDRPAVLVLGGLPRGTPTVPGTRLVASATFITRENCLVTGRVGTAVLPRADSPGRPEGSTVIMWPEGSTGLRDGDRVGVQLPDGTQVWAGEQFEGVGGRFDARTLLLPRGIPRSCGIDHVLTLYAAGDAAHRVPDCPHSTDGTPSTVPGRVCVEPRPIG